jgi:Mrp family chromosome partitioning ATPase
MTPTQIVELATAEEMKIMEGVFLNSAAGRRTAVFTAPDRESGCSWIVARVAQCLAQRVTGTVCVVDANLRWPSLHELFYVDNTRGLIQALEGPDEIRTYVQHIEGTNMWVLPSGGKIEDSHTRLLSDAVKTRLDELKNAFDYVLVDCAAMKASPDASILGKHTDGAVVVLAANSTNREGAMRMKLALEAANIPIAGAILNKRTYPIPESIHRYL